MSCMHITNRQQSLPPVDQKGMASNKQKSHENALRKSTTGYLVSNGVLSTFFLS